MAKTLIERTARAMYRIDPGAKRSGSSDFDSLPLLEQARYEALAKAAQTELLREPVEA